MVYEVGKKEPPISTAMKIKTVLIYLPDRIQDGEDFGWCMGWKFSHGDWHQSGSPTPCKPSHWAPLPPIPKKKPKKVKKVD
jgi:hypothetical protein